MHDHDTAVATPSKYSARRFAVLIMTLALAAVAACGGDDDPAACYGPRQNLSRAYQAGAQGCPCTPGKDQAVCLADETGRKVALICTDGHWQSAEDGPCAVR